ncbi:MAG: ATP-binding cassette domain-containing protein, partial [Eubacterium sp.]
MLSLPATFFKDYTAGDLSYRMSAMSSLSSTLINTVFVSVLSALFSFVYFFQISGIAPSLLRPSLLIIGASLFLTVFSTFAQLNLTRKKMRVTSKLNGLVYALFSGIQKIKQAGAERRAFSKWSALYKESADYTYNPPMAIKVLPVISTIIPLAGSILLYSAAGRTGVTGAEYMAFNVSYGMLSGSIMALAGLVTSFVSIQPTLEMVQPLLKAVPEIDSGKQQMTKVSGQIEVKNITFRYKPDTPVILHDISLKIEPGQYIGIVGKTGCGKSTLLRLLLGFESPQVGAIYYDGYNLESLDLKSLRSNIGVVTQDGRLFTGDIYSNIIISAPHLSVDDAWEAAALAGFDKDIENMPMGMHTIISEGDGGISGGQKQRLMIARALAPKPSIIMLDEATSALDNITQKMVSDAINGLKTTRIVIAHRLSTIKECDRILMLDGGKIIEDGSFDTLIAQKGTFAKLLERQMM